MQEVNVMRLRTLLLLSSIATSALGAEKSGFELSVLVDHEPWREYHARGTVYVEALRGRSYALRVTNPFPYRVGVALSVDGLNTIDAKHTTPFKASKWIIDPYESIVISGWQVSDQAARQFFFTGESRSYGAALGKTENLGVIEAVFFRERVPVYRPYTHEEHAAGASKQDAAAAPPSASAPRSSGTEMTVIAPPHEPDLNDDYAATGMGERRHHAVQRIDIDLEPTPVATIRIRYEFREQLARLGIFPARESRLDRRERARGFRGYSPEVD